MRKVDYEEFKKPYAQKPGSTIDDQFGDSLSLPLDSARKMKNEILSDIDEAKFGIGWWTENGSLKTKARILISDQLLQCVSSIETNLIEAKLHLLLLRGAWEQQKLFLAQNAKISPEEKSPLKLPERTKPLDDLADHLVSLHTTGFLQATGSALDCLGGTIIGVLALPTGIVESSFASAKRTLSEVKPSSPR